MDQERVIQHTKRWIESIVIGLNLCPFARRVFRDDVIRYVVSPATDEQSLLADLENELTYLASIPREQVETTILIHPMAFQDFLDYNDFLTPAEESIVNLGFDGIIQLASFHPEYQFGGTSPDDVENESNRSPYPMLHLLREISITEIADDDEALADIPDRNIATLRAIGRKAFTAMKEQLKFESD